MTERMKKLKRLTNNELQHAIERAEADLEEHPDPQKQLWVNDLRWERTYRTQYDGLTVANPHGPDPQGVKTLNDLLKEHPEWGDLPVFIYDGTDRENVLGLRVTAYVSTEPPVDWSCQGQWLILNTD